MATLFWDGDKRRVYEVPAVDQSFTTDGNGYRVYTPSNPGLEESLTVFTELELWTEWVDYHNINKWAYLAFSRAGGQFRQTVKSVDEYAPTELRFINEWAFVPANYQHRSVIDGNVLPDLTFGFVFDTARTTVIPTVETQVTLSARGSLLTTAGSGGGDWTTAEKEQIRDSLGVDGDKTEAEGGQLQQVRVFASDAADN